MRGALKITFQDGSIEYFEVDPVGGNPDFAANLQRFLASPTIALILDNEVLVIPSTSVRQISITRLQQDLPLEQLHHIPGVLVGAKRILG